MLGCRFVGYVEEEAVNTYTIILDAIDKGAAPPHFICTLQVHPDLIHSVALHAPQSICHAPILIAAPPPPAGPLQKWQTMPAPDIGIAYWHIK